MVNRQLQHSALDSAIKVLVQDSTGFQAQNISERPWKKTHKTKNIVQHLHLNKKEKLSPIFSKK